MVNHEALNCEQVWREISNYVEGDVDAALRSTMDEHFRTCKKCASVLAGTRNVVALYSDERMLDVPAGFSRRLENRLAKNTTVSGRRWSSWAAWLVPVAAMALIAGGLWLAKVPTIRSFVRSQHAEPGNNIPPDLVVVVSDGAKLFHVPGCPFIHDKATERTMTAKEAIKEGYFPCTRCLRKYLTSSLTGHPGTDDGEREEEAEEASTAGR
ncbi:MAG: zf-HC2 domain-containing protein [Candidatus Sulfotelmatobacter sp.]